jgi:hypothetical protein
VSFAVVDPEKAKAASKAAAQLQRKLTSAIEEAAFDRLIASAQSITDAVRAVNCSLNGATLFNHIRPLERALELKDFAWRSAIRHKYGLPPVYASNRVAVCVCGQLIGTGHNHCCNRVLGPATTERHDMVVGCLEDMMREEFGFRVRRLPSEVRARVRNGDRSKFIIPDLVVTDERKGEQWAIDVTGLYGESDSYLPKQAVGELTADELCGRAMDVLRARDKRKDVHYDALKEIGEAEVIPFTFESHGGLSERAEQFITEITDYAANEGYLSNDSALLLAGYMRRRISIAIQRGNASLDARASSSQRNSYAARASLGSLDVLSSAA